MTPPAPLVAGALAAVVLIAGCGDSESSSTTTTSADVTTTTPLDSDTTVTIEDGTTISVTLVDGEPEGGVQNVTVPSGEQVTLFVEADAADEVHVHGYDYSAEVAPGEPATLEFTADIPGKFEIEMEGSHVLIVELTVT